MYSGTNSKGCRESVLECTSEGTTKIGGKTSAHKYPPMNGRVSSLHMEARERSQLIGSSQTKRTAI